SAHAGSLQIGSRMVNARSETVATKPAFRAAFASRRCVVPADGYYEWNQEPDGKQPYFMHRKDQSGFFMAGLWEQNLQLSKVRDTPLISCTILTTRPNAQTAAIHDRMPVILSLEDAHRWMTLDARSNRQMLLDMLRPADDAYLDVSRVSRRVNSVRNDDPACILPADRQGELF
ncbi:MAG: SOS response-associated peptidase, partial [Planctomycetota bacterium]